jgi:hypothetical protein
MKEYDRLHEASDLVPEFVWKKWNAVRQSLNLPAIGSAASVSNMGATAVRIRTSSITKQYNRPVMAAAAAAAAAAGALDKIEGEYARSSSDS